MRNPNIIFFSPISKDGTFAVVEENYYNP